MAFAKGEELDVGFAQQHLQSEGNVEPLIGEGLDLLLRHRAVRLLLANTHYIITSIILTEKWECLIFNW